MKSILVHVRGDTAFEERRAVALQLARRFGAHLTLAQTTDVVVVYSTAEFVGTFSSGPFIDAIRAEATQVRERVQAAMAPEDVAHDLIAAQGDEATQLAALARLADLTVISAPQGGEGVLGTDPVFGAFAVDVHAPFLMVPRGCASLDVDTPAMVCWNGSAEAAAALRASVQLLQAMKTVHLVTVDDGHDGVVPGADAARYLARHGVTASILNLSGKASEVGGLLVETAEGLGAGLIVAGIYGHWRVLERLVGGASRSLVEKATVPVLFSR
jgi:nucleotide-binding universal stress UspA family protein